MDATIYKAIHSNYVFIPTLALSPDGDQYWSQVIDNKLSGNLLTKDELMNTSPIKIVNP